MAIKAAFFFSQEKFNMTEELTFSERRDGKLKIRRANVLVSPTTYCFSQTVDFYLYFVCSIWVTTLLSQTVTAAVLRGCIKHTEK